MVARRRRKAVVELEIIKTMLTILQFDPILYLKKQRSILRCFCSLKFEKSLFSNKFFSFIFPSKMKVQTAEKDQMKYFAQNYLGKITVFYVQTAAWFSAAKKNKFIQVCGVLHKTFSPLRELQGFEIHYTMNNLHTKYNTSSKHKKTKAI